jgi:site-specific recombinase XerD
MGDVSAAWLAAQRSENTRAAYGNDLARFVEWCGERGVAPLQATGEDMAAYGVSAADGVGDATAARRLSAVSSFFRYAQEHQVVEANPASGVARPDAAASSTTPALDGGEAEALLDASDRLGFRTAALVGLLLLDGLKLNEALAVDIDDLDGAPPRIVLSVERRGRPVLLELHPRTASTVAGCRRGRRSGPLLRTESPTRGGLRLSRFGADYLLKQAAAEAGLRTTVSANVLRCSFVQHALDVGRSLASVQAHVGHDDRRTTLRLAGPS